MLNDFTGGGQIFLHKLRMFAQVLYRSGTTALSLGIVVTVFISYGPYKKLDSGSAFTYQKALLAESLDEAFGGSRDGYFTKIDAGRYGKNLDPRTVLKSPKFRDSYAKAVAFLKERLFLALVISAGIFLFICGIWSKFGKDVKSERKSGEGGKVLSGREVAKILKASGKASDLRIGEVPLVLGSETRHFLVTGATGSGKTNLIRSLLRSVEKEGRAAIIVDRTGESIAEFYDPGRGDIIFNPFDARAKVWDFWEDCSSEEEVERFAKILFSFNRKKIGYNTDPFWELAAESVFIACAGYLKKIGGRSVEGLVRLAGTSSPKDLRDKLKGTGASRYLDGDGKNTSSSILSVLSAGIKPLARLKDAAPGDSFSLKEYFKTVDRGGPWLFLAARPSSREASTPLLACLAELAFSRLLEIGVNEKRRLWFVLDELASLGKLPALPPLMAEGRKYGACVLAGLQSVNQLYSDYGRYEGSTVFGQFGTKFFFRNSEPEAAKILSEASGYETVYRPQKTDSFGANEYRDGVSYSEHKERQNLVEPTDLANLAVGECFALLPEPAVRIAKFRSHFIPAKNKNPGFVQATASKADAEEKDPYREAVSGILDED